MSDLFKDSILADDGEARITIDYDPQNVGDVVILTVSNGGGFSSVYCNEDDAKRIIENLNLFLGRKGALK